MYFKPGAILTALCAVAAALPAANVGEAATTEVQTLEARQGLYGGGLQIFYDRNGRLRLFGLMKIPAGSLYDSFTTGSPYGFASDVARSLYQHMRQTLVGDERAEAFIISTWDGLLLSTDPAENGQWQGSLGTQIDGSSQLAAFGYDEFYGFCEAVRDYFTSSGVQVNFQEVPDAFAEGAVAKRSLRSRQSAGDDQFCYTPADLRTSFSTDAPNAPDTRASCA